MIPTARTAPSRAISIGCGPSFLVTSGLLFARAFCCSLARHSLLDCYSLSHDLVADERRFYYRSSRIFSILLQNQIETIEPIGISDFRGQVWKPDTDATVMAPQHRQRVRSEKRTQAQLSLYAPHPPANVVLASTAPRPSCTGPSSRAHVRFSERVKLVVAFNDGYAARRWLSFLAVFTGFKCTA